MIAPPPPQNPQTPKELFLQSLNRCTEDERFIPAFYERFLASSHEIRSKFRQTDFERQNKMLLRSLKLCAGATAGDAESLRELRERAETHDRYHYNIEPRLYEFWLDAVIQTARDFDNQWDESVEKAWHTILGYVIKQMVKHY